MTTIETVEYVETTGTLKPIKKGLLVELIKKDMVSAGGIVLAQADKEEITKGRILAIGSEVTLVEVGQVVLSNWQKAKKVKHDMKEFWIVNEDDLVLVFEGE
jgi:co-chaperonin GroES (HSP10)